MTTTGTSHFETLNAAVAYYRGYFTGTRGDLLRYVRAKVSAGEIHLGPPKLQPGQRLTIHSTERRYFVTE